MAVESDVKTKRKRLGSPLLTGDRELDRKRLNILLILNGKSKTDVANDLGLAPQTVAHVVNRHENSRTVFEYLENLPHQDMADVAL